MGRQTLLEQIESALKGGATLVQLREKDLPRLDYIREAAQATALCHRYGVPLILNDDAELAQAAGADGVHVGQSDMEAGRVRAAGGRQTHRRVRTHGGAGPGRQAAGADYLGVGAVFPTGSKADAVEVDHQTLREICRAVQIPVIAIGGITKDNVKELNDSGICGIAVISAILPRKIRKKRQGV